MIPHLGPNLLSIAHDAVRLGHALDIATVQSRAAALGRELSFAPRAVFHVMRAVAELGQRLLNESPGSLISIRGLRHGDRACLILVAESRTAAALEPLAEMDETLVTGEGKTRLIALKWSAPEA